MIFLVDKKAVRYKYKQSTQTAIYSCMKLVIKFMVGGLLVSIYIMHQPQHSRLHNLLIIRALSAVHKMQDQIAIATLIEVLQLLNFVGP